MTRIFRNEAMELKPRNFFSLNEEDSVKFGLVDDKFRSKVRAAT